MSYSKPYLPVPDQRLQLQQRGLSVPDVAKAEEYLRRIGYYRLSAYWYPFRQLSQNADGSHVLGNSFKAGSSFEHVTDLYAFDKTLRLIALDAIERIEISVRTEFALALGALGAHAHRDPKQFEGRFSQLKNSGQASEYQSWLRKLDEKEKYSKEEFADHFRLKYAGEAMPVWIAVELLDFGPLSIALSQLRHTQQQQVSMSYGGISFRLIQSWVRALCGVRNICAHHSRLWNKPLINQPAMPRAGEAPDLDHLHYAPDTNKRIYAVLAVTRFLLREINPRTKWADRLKAHVRTFPTTAPNISLKDAGFPNNWETLALWN